MIKKNNKKIKIALIIIAAAFLAASGIIAAVIFKRPPVIIVIEQSFHSLYGENRVKRETIFSTIALLRMVKTISVANDAGDDIISQAVNEIYGPENNQKIRQPYCVIFPLRFAEAAKLYREENPDTPIVIMEGRFSSFPIDSDDSQYYVYGTNFEADMYRAGIAAAAITAPLMPKITDDSGQEEDSEPVSEIPKKEIVVFWGAYFENAAALFKQAVGDFILERKPVFNEQMGEHREQRAESSKQRAKSKEQLTESNEQRSESNEQRADTAEQAEEAEEQAAEGGEQLPARRVSREVKTEPAVKSPEPEMPPPEVQLSQAEESGENAGNGENAADSAENPEEALPLEESFRTADSSDNDFNNPLLPKIHIYPSFIESVQTPNLSCVVMVDSGSEFFDKKARVSVIAFSWFNPILMPKEVALIIDDSPWAQTVRIVRMVKNKVEKGVIGSKFHFLNKNVFNREIIRKIKKSWKNAKIQF